MVIKDLQKQGDVVLIEEPWIGWSLSMAEGKGCHSLSRTGSLVLPFVQDRSFGFTLCPGQVIWLYPLPRTGPFRWTMVKMNSIHIQVPPYWLCRYHETVPLRVLQILEYLSGYPVATVTGVTTHACSSCSLSLIVIIPHINIQKVLQLAATAVQGAIIFFETEIIHF